MVCEVVGKCFCFDSEWNLVCVGFENIMWFYGDVYVEGVCNDDYDGVYLVVDYFGISDGVWDSILMNDFGIN